MSPDWTKLAPNRPLSPGESTYVERRPHETRIADWVLVGKDVVLVAGPVGIGKSTELAQAAHQIAASRVAVLVPLDRLHNMRTLTADQVRDAIARCLEGAMATAGSPISLRRPSARDHLIAVTREVVRLQGTKPCLLIDGLEKALPEVSKEAFDALLDIQQEVSLVVVVPWSVTYGPDAHSVLAADEKLVVQRPVDVSSADAPGARFLRQMAIKRLELATVPADFEEVLNACAKWSGGVPRTFLQLLADAATWARLSGDVPWPDIIDVDASAKEQSDSFSRLLLPGDDRALQEVDGTDGREMELSRKLRLLSHGMLLEREEDSGVVMRVPPLVAGILRPSARIGDGFSG